MKLRYKIIVGICLLLIGTNIALLDFSKSLLEEPNATHLIAFLAGLCALVVVAVLVLSGQEKKGDA